jgi:transcriptional regulator with XRE-family HTH domain
MKTKNKTLAELMLESSMGPQELADRIGAGRTSVWRWMNGHSIPRNGQVKQVASALGIPESVVAAAITVARSRERRRELAASRG